MMLKGGWHHSADMHLTWAEWQRCHAVLPQLLPSCLCNYHIVVYNEKVFILSLLSAACRHGPRSNWSPPPRACRASLLPRPMMAWWASSCCRAASPQQGCRLLTQAACMLRYYSSFGGHVFQIILAQLSIKCAHRMPLCPHPKPVQSSLLQYREGMR